MRQLLAALLCLLLCHSLAAVVASLAQVETDTMVELGTAWGLTGAPHYWNSTNTANVCSWLGVTCSTDQFHINSMCVQLDSSHLIHFPSAGSACPPGQRTSRRSRATSPTSLVSPSCSFSSIGPSFSLSRLLTGPYFKGTLPPSINFLTNLSYLFASAFTLLIPYSL